jgi:hypothetical protein
MGVKCPAPAKTRRIQAYINGTLALMEVAPKKSNGRYLTQMKLLFKALGGG